MHVHSPIFQRMRVLGQKNRGKGGAKRPPACLGLNMHVIRNLERIFSLIQ